jgi:hypothetical protein
MLILPRESERLDTIHSEADETRPEREEDTHGKKKAAEEN